MLDQPYPGKLAEVAKRYWVEESRRVPVMTEIAEKLKMPSTTIFQKSLSWMRKLLITRKSTSTTNGQTKDRQTFRNQKVWQPLEFYKCLMQPFNMSSNTLNLKYL